MERTLGKVTVGDVFVYTKDPEMKNATGLEGEALTVVRFNSENQVNRVVLKRPNGEEVLFSVEAVEKAEDRADANMNFVKLTLATSTPTAVLLDANRISGMKIVMKDGVKATVLALTAPDDSIPVKETPEKIAEISGNPSLKAIADKLRNSVN